MHAKTINDRRLRNASIVCAAVLAALLFALIQPATQAHAAAPKTSTCVGTAKSTVLTFTVAKTYRQWGSKTYRTGGAKRFGERSQSAGTTTHKLNVVYCKSKGTSTWKLWSWYSMPVYGSATVTIKNDKIIDASGPLALVKSVGTGTFSGTSRQYVEVRPFHCVDGKLTASMKAQQLAKFVTGLPIPQPAWSSVATWGVSNAIPDVKTPRECAYAGPEKLTFSPNSSGTAVWTSNMKTSGQFGSIFTKHGKVQSAYDGSWTEYWTESTEWRLKGK